MISETMRHAAKMQDLIEAVLDGSGEIDARVRRAIATRAATLGGGSRADADGLPEPLAAYVDIVSTRAHETTDEDVAGLIRAGYSENAVFEITVAASLGAAMTRMEQGMAALHGDRE